MAEAGTALTGELNFTTAPKLLEEYAGSDARVLDLSGVTRVDSAGLALLLELKRDSKADGGLRFTGAPEQLRKLAGFFGLTELLELG